MLLTPASLLNSLETLAAAKTEAESGLHLVTAATLIQESVIRGLSADDYDEAVDSIPTRLEECLDAVLNRTVEFQNQADGSCLGLWMVPVVVSIANASLPPVLALETDSMNLLKIGGDFLKQMGLNDAIARAKAGQRRMGWTHVVPCLYSLEQITTTDIFDLVTLPVQVQTYIRGGVKDVSFNCGELVEPGTGMALYFLPVVVNHPEGQDIPMPTPSEQMSNRLASWVAATIRKENNGLEAQVRASVQPHPFTVALDTGEDFYLDFKVRNLLATVSENVNVHPHGMAALVAPYAVQRGEQFILGITLVSRMTKAVLANMAIPVDSDGTVEAHIAADALRAAGVESVELHEQPVISVVCQHCGELQYAKPQDLTATRGVLETANNIQ